MARQHVQSARGLGSGHRAGVPVGWYIHIAQSSLADTAGWGKESD